MRPVRTCFPLSRFQTLHRANTSSLNYLAHIMAYVPQWVIACECVCTDVKTKRREFVSDRGNSRKDNAVRKFKRCRAALSHECTWGATGRLTKVDHLCLVSNVLMLLGSTKKLWLKHSSVCHQLCSCTFGPNLLSSLFICTSLFTSLCVSVISLWR